MQNKLISISVNGDVCTMHDINGIPTWDGTDPLKSQCELATKVIDKIAEDENWFSPEMGNVTKRYAEAIAKIVAGAKVEYFREDDPNKIY